MIKSATITNHLGESIFIELRFPERSGILIYGIDGLGPVKADINMLEVSNLDGSIFNSSRATSRNIVFSLGFSDNPSIEKNRQKTYKYFPLKRKVKVKVETDSRICEVDGYVESNEPNIFSKREGTTISIICPDSWLYFGSDQITTFSSFNSLFEFPFSNESLSENLIIFSELDIQTEKNIYYEGDVSVGIVITIRAVGDVSDIEIINVETLESIIIDSDKLIALTGYDVKEGDEIIISTVKGDKYVHLIRDGVTVNILNVLGEYPTWFEIHPGDNLFTYTASTGISNLQFEVRNKIAYEGI